MRAVSAFLLLALTLTPAPQASVTQRVAAVLDGDTIVLADKTLVRYIGVDAPERHGPDGRQEVFSKEATLFNARLVAGKSVSLQFDARLWDVYNRLLAYVFVDGVLVNAELVRWGYARTTSHTAHCKYGPFLQAMERIARRQNRGIWAIENLMTRDANPLIVPGDKS